MDPVTGWVDFDDPKLQCLSRDQVVALHHRRGNVTHIAELRQEMAAIANSPVPFGNARILYRETQGGDYIEISPLDALEREWEILSAGMKPGLRLAPTFVRQFHELIAVARQEGNPIYFG
jgi:hypothetical protein